MDKSKRKFRLATRDDLPAINHIYNQAIEHRHQTADLQSLTINETGEWFEKHDIESYPIFVIEMQERVVAWSSLSSYRTGRQALKHIAEISYYVDQEFQGTGLGKMLMESTMAEASSYKFRILVAILLDTNVPSKGILKKYGFEEWGRVPGGAEIGGEFVDHLYYGLVV